jgi:hypothetical protein
MERGGIDVFIISNKKESINEIILKTLDDNKINAYFLSRKSPTFSEWNEVEKQNLKEAKAVLVILGKFGWESLQLKITTEAIKLNKNIIPVLIEDLGKEALDKAYSLFKSKRYLDLRKADSKSINELLDFIKSSKELTIDTSQFDQLINTLVDGNEEQRANLLHQIQASKFIDRASLSSRLRLEIQNKFSPDKLNNFASAIRDPEKLSSIRSWMLSSLIWTDAENEINSKLLLDHLNTEVEPNANVRYWTLAGLYQSKVTYLETVINISLSDKSPVVSLLAQAIKSDNDSVLIETFRKALFSDSFDDVWQILRVLRIIPIPELAKDVCELLNQTTDDGNIAYDAFYAIANPIMTKAAVNILVENPGIQSIINRIIRICSVANVNATRNFSRMLIPFNEKDIDSALATARNNNQTREIAKQIIDFVSEYRLTDSEKSLNIAGYASDTINVSNDWLGIQEDVKTLTSVIIAKEVTPPLAIGLFGDWGSGKSFFIKSIQAEVESIQKKNESISDSSFCNHVVQIDFNAWHYVDTNLWASLVSSIFEKLATHVSPGLSVEEQQAVFLSELGSTKSIVIEAESEKQRAQLLIEERQKELQKLQSEREQKEFTLKDLRIQDIHSLLNDDQKKFLDESLNEIGLPAALNSISDLSNTISEAYTVKGRLTALFLSVLNSNNRNILILLLFVLLLIIPAATWLAIKYLNFNDLISKATAIFAAITAVISSLTYVLRKAIIKVNSSIAYITETKQRIDKTLASKQKDPSIEEIELKNEIASLQSKELEAQTRLSTATSRMIEIEERIRSYREERSLTRFLTERTHSEDYRKHLGLISTIRHDLESLTDKLIIARTEVDSRFIPVDRIILYIDDLDRCPSDKVMEVLQAVHLLLAYPLFVVVVGVDPRWLINSLGSTFSAFQNNEKNVNDNNVQWHITPQNYLEKIFQIPFSLRPMTENGYGKLIQELLNPTKTGETNIFKERMVQSTLENSATNKSDELIKATNEADSSDNLEKVQDSNLASNITVPKNENVSSFPKKQQDQFVINERSLVIQSWEAKFAEDLFTLIPTPRSAKRFSNIYRVLKASVSQNDLITFEGSTEMPGKFQVPMILLSILTGNSSDAKELFPYLLSQAKLGRGMRTILSQPIENKLNTSSISSISIKVKPIVESQWFPDNPELLLEWIPKVSRFSFEIKPFVKQPTD